MRLQYVASRVACAVFGHAWARQSAGVDVCTRFACRGRVERRNQQIEER